MSFQRNDVEKSIEQLLKDQGLEIVVVDASQHKNLPDHLSSINSKNSVFFIHNIEKGFPELLQYLNFKRETIAENHIKVVFWVTEEELTRISREAPDFFAFRNRVVEFMEIPLVRENRPEVIDFALETEYKSLDEIKRSIELKEKLLAGLSGDDEISGYLLGSLGILYDQIGSYKKAIEYHEKALAIAVEIGDRKGEGNAMGNLGLAYYSLGHIEKAIDHYQKALAIAQEIGDRKGEGADLGNLDNTYYSLDQVEKGLEHYQKALSISQEIGDRRNEGNWFGILGNTYYSLGQVEKAIEYYKKALSISQEIGDKRGEGTTLNNLGVAFENMNKYEEALECYLRARDIRTEIKDPNLKKTEANIKELKKK